MKFKISIEGDYWDSFIYRGRLYLWTMNCSILCIDWQRLVRFYSKKFNFDIFSSYLTWIDGNYLYKQNLNYLFKDKEFKQYLVNKLNKNKEEIYLKYEEIVPFIVYEKDCPNKVLPIDIEVYRNDLYSALSDGLYLTKLYTKKKELSSRNKKLWDCKLFNIRADFYSKLALSAGEDGLFELELGDNTFHLGNEKVFGFEKNIYSVDSNFSNYANYSNISIVNCNYQKTSDVILFKWQKMEDSDRSSKSTGDQKIHYLRRKDRFISLDNFYNNRENVIVGSLEDRIYIISSHSIKVLSFKGSKITSLLDSSLDYGEPEFCFNAFFGVIIVYPNNIVVLGSDGNLFVIKGDYCRCRVFPRSINYLNHLHCIKDNCIEIYSLMHDYFFNNNEKKYGAFYNSSKYFRNSSSTYFDDFINLE